MKRRLFCMMMVTVMVLGLSINVCAEEGNGNVVDAVEMEQEADIVEAVESVSVADIVEPMEIVQDEASVAAACTHPQWTWACRKNYIETRTNQKHKYGLFFATCTSTVKYSTVRNFCYICKANMTWYDTNDTHDCLQIHQDCGKGTEDICTIIGQYSIKKEEIQ